MPVLSLCADQLVLGSTGVLDPVISNDVKVQEVVAHAGQGSIQRTGLGLLSMSTEIKRHELGFSRWAVWL